MQSLRAKVDKVLEWAIIILMAVMVLNVLWQVFSRYLLQNPSSFTDELARYLLIWLGLLGASYGVSKKIHLAIELITAKLSDKQRLISDLFIYAVIFLFALLVMVIGGIRLMHITLVLNQISAALQIKIGYVYSVIPLSGVLMMFYALVFAIEDVRAAAKSG